MPFYLNRSLLIIVTVLVLRYTILALPSVGLGRCSLQRRLSGQHFVDRRHVNVWQFPSTENAAATAPLRRNRAGDVLSRLHERCRSVGKTGGTRSTPPNRPGEVRRADASSSPESTKSVRTRLDFASRYNRWHAGRCSWTGTVFRENALIRLLLGV